VARVFLSGTPNQRVSAAAPIGAYVYGYERGSSFLTPAGMSLVDLASP